MGKSSHVEKGGSRQKFVRQLVAEDQQNIRHNKKFEPTGFLVDSGWDVVSEKIPSVPHDLMYKGSKKAVQELNQLG